MASILTTYLQFRVLEVMQNKMHSNIGHNLTNKTMLYINSYKDSYNEIVLKLFIRNPSRFHLMAVIIGKQDDNFCLFFQTSKGGSKNMSYLYPMTSRKSHFYETWWRLYRHADALLGISQQSSVVGWVIFYQFGQFRCNLHNSL